MNRSNSGLRKEKEKQHHVVILGCVCGGGGQDTCVCLEKAVVCSCVQRYATKESTYDPGNQAMLG